MQLQNKVAFVTGAGSGIGKASALLFALEGAKIACVEVDLQSAQETVAEIERNGGQAIAVRADVSQPQEVQEAVAQTVDKFGRLDICFANAGINGVWAPIEDLTPEEWDQTQSINLKGTFLTIKYAYPHMKREANGSGGAVLITSSVNGTRTFKGERIAYACTKAGQVVLARCLAVEFAKHDVRINTICPGAIETNINASTEARDTETVGLPVVFPEGRTPLNKGVADHVAQLALFLASDASSHISGTETFVDGAETLIVG